MIKVVDFEDLAADEIDPEDKTVNVTFKVTEEVRDMFMKIAKRERRNMSALGSIIVEDFINDYVKSYEEKIEAQEK